MPLAADLINDNGISSIALGFFAALFTMVGTVTVAIVQAKGKIQEIKVNAKQAAIEAANAQRNTKSVANGFAERLEKKLDLLAINQDRLENAFMEHVQWHLEKKDNNA